MAFFHLVLKANKLRNLRKNYHEEKLRSIQITRGEKVHYTFWQRVRRKRILLKRKIRGCLHKVISCPGHAWLHKKSVLLRTDGTLENFLVKSFCGFVGGVILTYLFFVFFVFQLHFGLTSATLICAFLGVFLTLGLAFSPRIRCIVFLFLPQFFSKRGRQALMAYAFILALTGPARNTLHNLSVLSESLSCCQGKTNYINLKKEQLKEAVKAVMDLIKQPFYALKSVLSRIINSIKAIVKRIKQTLIAIKRLVISILRVIKSVFEWLGSVVNICNKKFGSPFDRCKSVFEGAVADCRAKLGPYFGNICNVTYVAGTVCVGLKPLDLVCMVVSYVSDAIIGVVRKKIKRFTQEVKAMFYVKIKFSHSFDMKTTKSKSIAEVSSKITSEIKAKANRFLYFFDWVGFFTSFLFLILLLRVIYYRYKWLTSDRFDNRYISSYMREIDLRRARQDKETIFPLNHRERNKYVALSSLLLIKSEKIRMTKSAVFLSITSVKLAIYMTIDYCLFWVLDRIRYHGRMETKFERPSYTSSARVKGQGFLADIYRSIVRAFKPYADEAEFEEVPCLPEPKPPDYDAYVQIATLALFCWIMALFEPYGLRLRHAVLNLYYPDRAKQRAVWLYNRIIRSRGSFLKYARRQLRRQFGTAHDDGIEKVSLRERLWAVFPLLERIAPLKLKNACLLCGSPEDKSAPHVRCPTPSCVGVFCGQCFLDLRKLCTICKSPLDYGDLTDISEERDSSDEDIDVSRLKKIPLKPDAATDETDETIIVKKDELIDSQGLPSVHPDTSDDDSTKYSYSYQDEPTKDSVIPQKIPFKDVEAQEIRDDVTIQIFSEPLSEDLSSGSEQVFCFGLAKQKKFSKSKRKEAVRAEDDMRSDSASIADTESWTTEVVQDNQESILDIEIEDFDDQMHSSQELLTASCKKKAKHKTSRFKRIFKVFTKIFKKKKEKQAKPFQAKNYKDSILIGDGSDESSSSVSSICAESHELLVLPKPEDRSGAEKSVLRKRNSTKLSEDDEYLQCKCSQSSQESRMSSKERKSLDYKKYSYAHLMKFKTKELPRHLTSVCSSTKYFEIDESSCYTSPREKIEYRADFSTLSDTLSSVDSDPSRERRSSTNNDNDSYIYTSENNEKRYETHSRTSNTSSPEDFGFSGMSTDSSDKKQMIRLRNVRITNEEQFSEEGKINDESDEKGKSQKEQIRSEKTKPYDAIKGLQFYNIKGKGKSKSKTDNKEMEIKETKEPEKSLEKEPVTNEKSDVLRRDKVEKETANAKRKNLLTQESPAKKVDKSINVQEEDIDNFSTSNERSAERSEHYQKGCQQKVVYGFQPIVSEKDKLTRHHFQHIPENDAYNRKMEETVTEETCSSENQPQTKDQGTYVRLKTKKAKHSSTE